MDCLTKAKRVEFMWRFYRLLAILVFVAGGGILSMMRAQEPAESPAPPPQQATDAPAVQQAPDPDLATEVQQLRAELDQLKNQMAQVNSILEQLQANQAATAKVTTPPRTKRTAPATSKKTMTPAAAPNAPAVVEPDEATPTTVLVFHDGRRIEARNYAIVGQSLWIYTADDSKKVPLADLDVAATKTANSDRGVVFQLPPTK